MRKAIALALLAALASQSLAAKRGGAPAAPDVRVPLADQLTAEAQAIARALATITDKLTALDATRARRLRAAARLLHEPLPPDVSADERMAYARRRASARLLVDRDRAERALLAAEADHLRAADVRVAGDTAHVPSVTLPATLLWPVRGSVSRHFGPFEHESTHATLSRRGIDIDVEERAPVVAPVDGIVRYAGPIRGFERGVVIDCGEAYAVVAKLDDIVPPVGAHISKGDRLGHAARRRVYLELRAKIGPGGLPVDPEPLLTH